MRNLNKSPVLLNTIDGGSIEITNSQNGNRSRYSSGIFLSQIYTSQGEHRPKSIEFAIRSIRGNKAFLRTNNTSLFCEVVEAVSHPIKCDTFPKFTKTQNSMIYQLPKINPEMDLFSMVERNRHAFSVAAYPLGAVSHPVTFYRQTVRSLAVVPSTLTNGATYA